MMAMLYHRKPLNENIRTCLLCYIRATLLQGALYFCDHYNLIRKHENINENIRTCLLCYIRATVLQGALYFCDHYNLIRKQINYPEQKLKQSSYKIESIQS